MGSKVKEWISEVTLLAEFAISQPQACYAAFTFGLRHKWTYFMRALPDIEISWNHSSVLSQMSSYRH